MCLLKWAILILHQQREVSADYISLKLYWQGHLENFYLESSFPNNMNKLAHKFAKQKFTNAFISVDLW